MNPRVVIEFVGGPHCGKTRFVDADPAPAQLGDVVSGGHYVPTDRVTAHRPDLPTQRGGLPIYEYVPPFAARPRTADA